MSENLRTYERAIYAFDAVVNRVDPATWTNQSPCDKWCAKEVVGHTLTVAGMVAATVKGEEPSFGDPMEAAGDDPVASWAAARDDVLGALDRQGALQAIRPTPFGEIPVDAFLGIIYADPLIHAWDLARATGQHHGIPDDLAEKGLASLTPVDEVLRGPDRFDDAQSAPEGTDLMGQLAAFSGRRV